MSDFFDNYVLDATHEVVKALYSDTGVWSPPDGAPDVTDNGFFTDPTKAEGVGVNGTFFKGMPNFRVDSPVFEYLQTQYAGLKEAADQKKTQYMTVKGLRFKILEVKAAYDGTTLYAILSKTPA